MKTNNKPLFFFYILVCYVIIQFFWWAYLLVDLNNEIHALKLQLLSHENANSADALSLLNSKLKHKRTMIIGEGFVFLSLLIFGFYQTRKAFKKEQALARQQKNFLLSITHELKSPLAAIQLQTETLLLRDLGKEKQTEILNNTLQDTDRLNSLVNNLLTANSFENENYQLNFEALNLNDLIKKTVTKIELQHKRTIHLNTNAIPEIISDKIALESILLNLLENSVKYSEKNTLISIGTELKNERVLLRIADNGLGIPDDEKTKVFEKFYRIGNEETRKTKGTGLGLFIVKNLIGKMNGSITLLDNKPNGTIVEIVFTPK